MKRKILLFVSFITLFFLSFTKADALLIEQKISFNNMNGININYMDGDEIGSVDCSGIFTPEAIEIIREILGYFMVLGPIVLILMGTIDMGGAVISQDNDALKKATGKLVKRALATVGLFLVPFLIRLVLGFPAVRNVIEISDPLCGTMSSIVNEEQIIIK